MTTTVRRRGYAAALLDVDGVLVDTEASVFSLWAEVCAALGRRPLDAVDRTHIVGCGVEHTITHLFGPAGEPGFDSAHSMLARLEPELDMAPVEGAAALVHELHDRGVRVVLVTGASRTRLDRVVDLLGVQSCLTATVTSGEAEGKPHPGPYLLAADRAGVAPAACVVVEDAPAGVRSAVSAGAACVGLASPHGTAAEALRLAGAEIVVTSLPAVAATLRDMALVRTDH